MLRAFHMHLLDDEGQTFSFYIQNATLFPWQKGYFHAPNNHFLNSIATLISYSIFGAKAFVLRLPNLLMFPVFALYLWKISTFINNRIIGWALFLVIFSSHYLIEFFGYSRGYGISLALLLGSLFHLYNWLNAYQKTKQLWYSAIFMLLSLSANLNLLYCAISWVAIVQLYVLLKAPRHKWFSLSLPVVLVTFSIFLFSLQAFSLKNQNQLYIGNTSGIMSSLDSLVPILIPAPSSHRSLIYSFFLLLFALLFIRELINAIKKNQLNITVVIGFFFLLNVLAAIIANVLLDVKFPIERTILHWYLLLILFFFFAAQHLKRWLALLLLLPFLVIPFKGFTQLSFTRAHGLWAVEYFPKEALGHLNSIPITFKNAPILATYLGTYKHSLDFKAFGENNNIIFQLNAEPDCIADVQLAHVSDYYELAPFYILLKADSLSGFAYYQRKKPLQRYFVGKKSFSSPLYTNAFQKIGAFEPDSLINDTLLFTARINLLSEYNSDLILAITGKNVAGETLFWKSEPLSNTRKYFNGKSPQLLNMYTFGINPDVLSLEFYLWNLDEEAYETISAEFLIQRLSAN